MVVLCCVFLLFMFKIGIKCCFVEFSVLLVIVIIVCFWNLVYKVIKYFFSIGFIFKYFVFFLLIKCCFVWFSSNGKFGFVGMSVC